MRLNRVLAVLALAAIPASADAQIFFADDFDTYAAGSTIAGQGGWETWDNAPGADATVVNTQAFSGLNSLAVSGPADVVHRFTGANSTTSPVWFARVQTFVPSTASGDLFFILMNQYTPVSGPNNWSAQVALCRTGCISGIAGTVANLGGSDTVGSGTAPLILDQWVELRAEINFTANTYSIFYNHQLVETLPWTQTGSLQIAAVDLYSQSNTVGFMDGFYLDETLPVELTGFQVE